MNINCAARYRLAVVAACAMGGAILGAVEFCRGFGKDADANSASVAAGISGLVALAIGLACTSSLIRFTIRDLMWLIAVVGVACGWWEASNRAMEPTSAYRSWGFDIAAQLLKEKTGDTIAADGKGVYVRHCDGTYDDYRFGSGGTP